MAFQIRRGPQQNLDNNSFTPKQGELLYTTDTKRLYVGNNSGTADLVSAPVISVNGKNGVVELTTSDIPEPLVSSNNWFTVERAQDAVASALTAGTHTGITFTYGSTQDGSNRIDASVSRQVIVGDANIIGSIAYYDTASTVSYSTNLTYNNTTKTLTVIDGGLTVTAGNTNRAVYTSLNYSGNNSSANSSLSTRKSRGTELSPQPVIAQDTLGSIDFSGYTAGDYLGAVKLEASVDNYNVTSTAVPGLFGLYTGDNTGTLQPRVRVDSLGRVFIGAYYADDPGGQLLIRGALNTSGTGSILSVRNLDSNAGSGAVFSLSRLRGTYASPAATQTGDSLAIFRVSGWDGVSGTSVTPITSESSRIEFIADSVSTGRVPGSILIRAANTNGVLTTILRINNSSTSTSVGTVTVSGTIATTSTPGTFWNYDTSGSTLNLTTGGTVNFSNFSGSVLVNCYNSGTVTQYLCGGGSAPIETGSSKPTPTGTMAFNSGIGGYTFTATETGVHSFYVIRTRTGG